MIEPYITVLFRPGFFDEDMDMSISKLFKSGFNNHSAYYGYFLNDQRVIFGRRLSFHDIPDDEHNRILRGNMERDNNVYCIITRAGHIIEYRDNDIIISPGDEYMGDLVNFKLHQIACNFEFGDAEL